MKFDMGSTTLSDLGKSTEGSSGDLGSLIRQLIAAADPLEGKFNGSGKVAFDSFKAHADVPVAPMIAILLELVPLALRRRSRATRMVRRR